MDDLLKRVKRRCMYLLADMDRTEHQIREKLKKGEYPDDIIEKAVADMKERHYLDDRRYTEHYILAKSERKSRIQIVQDLKQKGVSSETIDTVFEENFEEYDETEAILKFVKKKGITSLEDMDRVQTQKLIASLMRKGFRFESIRKVLDGFEDYE